MFLSISSAATLSHCFTLSTLLQVLYLSAWSFSWPWTIRSLHNIQSNIWKNKSDYHDPLLKNFQWLSVVLKLIPNSLPCPAQLFTRRRLPTDFISNHVSVAGCVPTTRVILLLKHITHFCFGSLCCSLCF